LALPTEKSKNTEPIHHQPGIPGPIRILDPDQPPPHEPDQYCAYHRIMGHRTEFCTDIRRAVSKGTNDTATSNLQKGKEPKETERPGPSARYDNINVISTSDLVVDPVMMIMPVNEPQPEPNLVNVRPRIVDHRSMAGMVMDLNPNDDDLPADYLENYNMHGRPHVNKVLRKKIAMHARIQEGETSSTPYKS